ncbi:hypothetical protein [Cerasicoccus fimbriatus]|uniref:hypothetical protein n=1 Tax=Cerasicoccus fimbriatus TaxID=3014554 RepID=UPI0022B4A788|nr:hypothetical protein [Cerasicoccus sp. TK19100]
MDDNPSKLRYIFWLIGNWFADIWHFLRFGLRDGFIRLLDTLDHTWHEITSWFGSGRERAKAAQADRREQAERMRMGLLASMAVIWDFILWLIRAPFRFVAWLWKLFQIMREMSFRAACAEAWGSYRELVDRALDHGMLLLYRFLDTRWWVKLCLSVIFISGMAAVIFGPWAIRYSKEIRSQSMLEEALALREEGLTEKAFWKSRAAAMLALDNEEALDLIIELSEELRSPETLWWVERKAKQENYTEESLAKVIEIAAYLQSPQAGTKYLSMLQERYPDSDQITEGQLRLLMSVGRRLEAIKLAQQAFKRGEDGPMVHEVLTTNLINTNEPGAIERTRKHLQENLYRTDESGYALQRLILSNARTLSDEVRESIDYSRLIEALRQQEEVESVYIAIAVCLAMEEGLISRQQAIDALLAEYDAQEYSEQLDAIKIACHFGLYEILDQAEEDQSAPINFRIERLLLGAEPDLAAAMALAESSAAELSPMDRDFWRAIFAGEQGDFQRYSFLLQQSIDFATEPGDLDYMQRIITAIGTPDQKMEFYNLLFRYFPGNPVTTIQSIDYAYRHGTDENVSKLIQQMPIDSLKQYPSNQLFLIYLKALYQRDLDACRIQGERLVMEYPTDALYYVVLAFTYVQSGQPELARELLGTIPPTGYEIMPPFVRLSLAATGYTDALPAPEALYQDRERELAMKLRPLAN